MELNDGTEDGANDDDDPVAPDVGVKEELGVDSGDPVLESSSEVEVSEGACDDNTAPVFVGVGNCVGGYVGISVGSVFCTDGDDDVWAWT